MYSTAHPPVIAVICTINIVRVHCRYDHRGDPGDLDWHGEHVNVVEDAALAPLVKQLHTKVLDYIQLFPQ